MPTTFGQVVIGPPGSGKTTYCSAMQQFLTALGRRVCVVNLDPANDALPYTCSVNISDLISLEEVMTNLQLGPNGGLVYCMEYLEQNVDWLQAQLAELHPTYLLIDCPGQVELYTHNNAVRNLLEKLTCWDYRLAAVHLVDSHYCNDPGKFISVLLTSLSTMLQVALPHVNVLSKADLIEKCGKLPFNLEFFTEVLDLSFILDQLQDDGFFKKYKKLNEALVGLVEDYSLVSFSPLDIQSKESMLKVAQTVDKANGYTYGELESLDDDTLHNIVAAAGTSENISNIQEKYMDSVDEDVEDRVKPTDITLIQKLQEELKRDLKPK